MNLIMSISSPFNGPKQRIDRAIAHKHVIAHIWNEAIPYAAYRPRVKMNHDGTGNIFVGVGDPTLMLTISLEYGELFYQLRAALDGAIYESAILQSGKTPPPNEGALQFPICSSQTDFNKARRNIAPLSDECKSFIESVQPYNAPALPADAMVEDPARTLSILGDLARKDRHRSLHAMGILPTTAHPEFRLPEGMSIAYLTVLDGGVLKDERIIATFKIDGFRPYFGIEVNPNLIFEIAIAEALPKRAENDTLNGRTESMIIVTGAIVDWFERYFNI